MPATHRRPPSVRLLGLAFATMSAFITMPALPDQFHLSSGKIVEGAIQSETPDRYVIQTEMGTINVRKADVVRTVSTGTSSLEVQGDTALKSGDVTTARTAWTQALAAADEGSPAEARLKDKLAKLETATTQAAANEITNLLTQARILLQNQRLDAAQAALDQIRARLGPGDTALITQVEQLEAEIHYAKGIAARDAVRLDLAQQELEQAIAANPNFYPAYLALGEMLMNNSTTAARATEIMEDGLRLAGDQITEARRYEILYNLAGRYFDSRNYSRAAATYAQLIPAREQYPAYADALDRAVEAYVRTGEENMSSDFRQTITTLNSALELNPRNEKALFLLGRIYLDVGQLENAVVTLERLVSLNAAYPEVHLYLGRAYFRAHDAENAIKHFTSELALSGNSYPALVDRAEAYISLGQYQSAETDLATARTIEPSNWLAYYLTASMQYERGNYEAAQQSLQEALSYSRAAIPAHLLMGRVLAARNQHDGARQWLEQVVTRLRQEPALSYRYRLYLAEALTRLGEIAIKDQSPRQAENYLNEALQADPNYAPALVASADNLLLMAATSSAATPEDVNQRVENLYLQATKLEPAEPDHYLKLARFYQLNANNNDKAREYYNKYVDAGGRDMNVNTWLTQVGGQTRDEITSAVAMAVANTPVFPGTVVTTSTATFTTGTAGPSMTTTTITGTVPAPGVITGTTGAGPGATAGTGTGAINPVQSGVMPLPATVATPGITAPPPSTVQPVNATPIPQMVMTETATADSAATETQLLPAATPVPQAP